MIHKPEHLEQFLIENELDVISIDKSCIKFWYNFNPVTFYFKKQWATGKSIEDCRGLENLIKQIKK